MFVDLLILGLGVLSLISGGKDNGYIEYTPGNTNLIITSPHDGHLTPESIPDRTPGCRDSSGVCHFPGEANCPPERICKVVLIPDRYSLDMARTFREVYIQRTGKIPHMVVNLLHRAKLDANRDIVDAAQNSRESIMVQSRKLRNLSMGSQDCCWISIVKDMGWKLLNWDMCTPRTS